jgi:hypothetical protein
MLAFMISAKGKGRHTVEGPSRVDFTVRVVSRACSRQHALRTTRANTTELVHTWHLVRYIHIYIYGYRTEAKEALSARMGLSEVRGAIMSPSSRTPQTHDDLQVK